MEDIEIKAVRTYQDNLQYLESYHKKLYDKIILLHLLIEEGTYQENFILEYKDQGYFDIKELSSGEYLYKENSTQHAKAMLAIIDKKRTGAVFQALKYVYATDEQAEYIDKSDLSFHNSLWATIKIINYCKKISIADSYMLKVYKAIFLGTGLGLHIQSIVEKLNTQVIFIKEKNLEIFRLSLFVMDYKSLSTNRSVYFSISNNLKEEKESFISFLDKGNNYNLYIKHIPFSDNYQENLKMMQGHVLTQNYINYGYSAMLLRFINSPKYLARGYSFLNVNKKYNDNILSHKPVLLLFSGPSSSNNLEWIKANHERFIIVSALSTCKLLNSINISPDIVIHMDPGEATSLLFDGINTNEYFKNTLILLSSNVNEDTVNRFSASTVHFIEQGTNYKKGFGKLSSPSVGEYAYGLVLLFGALNIYILGIDLSLDHDTLQSHGDFHFGQTQGIVDKESASLDPNVSIEYIKGNFKEQIPTVSGYKLSIEQFEIFTDTLKTDKHVIYNLSNGAYLKGSSPLYINKYNWEKLEKIDKGLISYELHSFFNEIGSSDFNHDDKEILKYQILEAKKLKKIIEKYRKNKYTKIHMYLNSLSQLAWDLSDMNYKTNSDLAQVYYEYFQIIQSYIFDLFNTKDLKNANKHIVEVDKILVRQLLKMSHLYINTMEDYLKF